MNPIVLIWLQFLVCVGVTGIAGVRLSRYGDAIASLTGLSRSWIGLGSMASGALAASWAKASQGRACSRRIAAAANPAAQARYLGTATGGGSGSG